MRRFEYLEARTLRQAIGMLRRHGPEARIVAGSTDFLVRWRAGFWHPDYVVNIQHVPGLSRVAYSRRNGLRLGALVTIQTLEQHPAIRQHYPALAAAAASFAGVQVRNLATVGGNICNASPSGDTLPALMAYGAECRLSGPDGHRQVPLDELFTGPGQTVLAQDENPDGDYAAAPSAQYRLAVHQAQPPRRHGHRHSRRGLGGDARPVGRVHRRAHRPGRRGPEAAAGQGR